MNKNCQYWIEEFKTEFFKRGGTDVTWRTEYRKVFNRLPCDQKLTKKVLDNVVQSTKPNTRSRVRAVMVTGKLARFAGVNYDPSPYKGKYSCKKSKWRDLPHDEQLVEYWSTMTNDGWRWVFGMIATYGLRPHETFLLDLDRLRSGNHVLRVKDGKTGERFVWPLHPEWFYDFRLQYPIIPPIKLDRDNERIGRSACHYFLGINCPWTLYDLRHRWAIRSLEYGLENTLAANQMGHSEEVHNTLYRRWIDQILQEQAYQKLLQRQDRPTAPRALKY